MTVFEKIQFSPSKKSLSPRMSPFCLSLSLSGSLSFLPQLGKIILEKRERNRERENRKRENKKREWEREKRERKNGTNGDFWFNFLDPLLHFDSHFLLILFPSTLLWKCELLNKKVTLELNGFECLLPFPVQFSGKVSKDKVPKKLEGEFVWRH